MEMRIMFMRSLADVVGVAAIGTVVSTAPRAAHAEVASPLNAPTAGTAKTPTQVLCTPAKSITLAATQASVSTSSGGESYSTSNCHSFLVEISVPAHPRGDAVGLTAGANVGSFSKVNCAATAVSVTALLKKDGATTFTALGSYKLVGHWFPKDAPGLQPVRGCGLVTAAGSKAPLNQSYPAAGKTDTVSLEPSPVLEAYKKDVDRTLLRENLKLSTDERVAKMIGALRLAEEIRRSSAKGSSG